jgi:hypothetical protein
MKNNNITLFLPKAFNHVIMIQPESAQQATASCKDLVYIIHSFYIIRF